MNWISKTTAEYKREAEETIKKYNQLQKKNHEQSIYKIKRNSIR
jgi:hypothetical protein